MEFDPHLEVCLGFISSKEKFSELTVFSKNEYELLALSALQIETKYDLFEEDLLNNYKDKTLKEIFSNQWSIIYGQVHRPNPHRKDILCPVYYDITVDLYIKPDHKFYDHFFSYQIKHTDLMIIDQFLSYQLEIHHNNLLSRFCRFLHLLTLKFKNKIIDKNRIQIIREWIAFHERTFKDEELSNQTRIRRRSKDNVTKLNHDQTVLFLYYLQQSGFFLRDEYLTDTEAGIAFELLTGYSRNTLRQDLGKYYLLQNKENLTKIRTELAILMARIDKSLN